MAIMRSTDFRSTVAPVLNTVFDGVYEMRDYEWKAIFDVEEGLPRSYHEEVVNSGFGAAQEIPDGAGVSYDAGSQLFKATFPYKQFGLAYAMTKVLVEDGEHIRMGSSFAKHLAQSMGDTKEIRCANHLNRAFSGSYLGGDGKSLVATDHPMRNGATYSNQLTTAAALSHTSLEQMLIQVRNAVDFSGKPITVTPKHLIVPPALMFTAETILNSALRSGTANNDINAIKSSGMLKGGVKVISRLTSNTAWFIQTDVLRGLRVFTRRKLTKSMEGDFETDSMKYKATERYSEGWLDPKCVWGTAGV